MVKSLLLPLASLPLLGTALPLAAQAEIPEKSVALCVTENQAVRTYYRSDQLRLRAYDRQDGVLWMNHVPALTTAIDGGTAYTNEFGEVTLTLRVMTDGTCSIQIGDAAPADGTLSE